MGDGKVEGRCRVAGKAGRSDHKKLKIEEYPCFNLEWIMIAALQLDCSFLNE